MPEEQNPLKIPLNKINFSPEPKNIFKNFKVNTNQMKSVVEKNNDQIECIVEDFIDKNPSLHESVQKAIMRMNLANRQRKFTLVPIIATYNELSRDGHHIQSIIESEEINHVFVSPISGYEGFFYQYMLYIPIPPNMRRQSSKELLKEHFNLVSSSLSYFRRKNMVRQFEPVNITSRIYGWEGAWLAYLVSIEDNNSFWSLPLVKTPYNKFQPFVGLEKGEFSILEYDATEKSKVMAEEAIKEIKNRNSKNHTIDLDYRKSIEVTPEWILAHGIESNNFEFNHFSKYSKDFGEKLPSGSMDKELDSSQKILDYMKTDIVRTYYTFSSQEIDKYKLKRM